MICIPVEIPKELCDIDDELKAIYHAKDSICIWVFRDSSSRNRFMQETIGMKKEKRNKYYLKFYA